MLRPTIPSLPPRRTSTQEERACCMLLTKWGLHHPRPMRSMIYACKEAQKQVEREVPTPTLPQVRRSQLLKDRPCTLHVHRSTTAMQGRPQMDGLQELTPGCLFPYSWPQLACCKTARGNVGKAIPSQAGGGL